MERNCSHCRKYFNLHVSSFLCSLLRSYFPTTTFQADLFRGRFSSFVTEKNALSSNKNVQFTFSRIRAEVFLLLPYFIIAHGSPFRFLQKGNSRGKVGLELLCSLVRKKTCKGVQKESNNNEICPKQYNYCDHLQQRNGERMVAAMVCLRQESRD